jgi:dTDP-4-amino-4,6-dideoxygalactose transaminase
VLGPQLTKFEEELARYANVHETVGVNSGTDALVCWYFSAWPWSRR